MENRKGDKKMIVEMTILTISMIAQIGLFIIFFNHGRIFILKHVGYFCWILSALFGCLPIYEFYRKGRVPKGKSYMITTRLVTSGVYSIVRHPQFLAGMLLSSAFILISQHWFVLILGITAIIILYKDMFRADISSIKKFGKLYKSYMKEVPRANFILGIIRVLKNKPYVCKATKYSR